MGHADIHQIVDFWDRIRELEDGEPEEGAVSPRPHRRGRGRLARETEQADARASALQGRLKAQVASYVV